ncbi:nuclear transport factor 2 family protein [Lysobacter solisilvae (ex Woo and Kim 2020)]|uniref:Nuclear transport factor 2 family protein n=1 Tax=Agrilutibacter terrestris TaxID=2865112 RepID=A0A7H0FZL3_9GAMM|nr:nuclear transport factor 2 family protein [Lysobacter terrestris]QNP41479.1 nuclear transport factor 2 family protein [Lysobacter terrestris]
MKSFQHALVAVALLLWANASHGAGPVAADDAQGNRAADLEAMLARYADAAKQFYDGRSGAVKALWSHADDVTLSGAAGGETAKGWRNVSMRLDWASAQFSRGSKQVELIQKTVSGDLAYVVQYEHILFFPPGKNTQSRRDYRVTTVFRREAAGWRVVHRHADMQMAREAIR